jgi:hypothetical protein
VVLSDLFPNVARFAAQRQKHPDQIAFLEAPIDATRVPNLPDIPRVRTIIGALHHFRPEQVRQMLADAAQHADGFAAFEGSERNWLSIASASVLPLVGTAVASFGLRPWRPSHLLWGAVVPVVPLTLGFDAVVSSLRSYTVDELRALADEVGVDDFAWEVGTAPIPGPGMQATYIMGWRRSRAASVAARRGAAVTPG